MSKKRSLFGVLTPSLDTLRCRIYFAFHTLKLEPTNVRGLSSKLDGDGGIAAPKKLLSIFLQFQEGWGDISPFFLPLQQESCLLIESKDIFYSSRRARL